MTHADNRAFFGKNPKPGEVGTFTDQNGMQLEGSLYLTNPSLGAAIVFKDSRAHLPYPTTEGGEAVENTMYNLERHINNLEQNKKFNYDPYNKPLTHHRQLQDPHGQ